MDYDNERRRLEKRLEQAQARLEKQEAKKRLARRSVAAVQSEQRDSAEKWHRFALAHHDREAGYEGDHALARMALRAQPFDKYVNLIRPYVSLTTTALVQCELAAVIANLNAWTATGREILMQRDQAAYEKERHEWEEWQSANPAAIEWREREPTKGQLQLVRRIVEAKEIETPTLKTRGEAHDWIAANGGNPRLNRDDGGAA